MLKLEQNKAIPNTFGMDVKAACFVEYDSAEDLAEIYSRQDIPRPFLSIGGGSNLLFTKDFEGTLLHSQIRGFKDLGEGKVYVGAGENWDDFCLWTCSKGLWGAENLSSIPGDCGSAIVQNIGAYGVEVKDILQSADCFDTESGKVVKVDVLQIGYGYRQSNFKSIWKGRYIVLGGVFSLSQDFSPRLDYGHVREAVQREQEALSPNLVRKVIMKIRDGKLPDPKVIGSAGSFFRNPFVSRELCDRILKEYPDLPHFPCEDGRVKISAAWLIDRCALKGYAYGGAAVYEKQPLVIVNVDGKASPQAVLAVEKHVVDSVEARFGIVLQPEVEHV